MKIENLKLKIVFFGSSQFVLPILEVLRKNYDLVLVLTTEKPASKGLALQGCPVISYCRTHNIPYRSIISFDQNLKSYIIYLKSDLAVLAYFGLILPKSVLELFPKGILNVHPSLLPKYRGPTPAQTAILNGDEKTGVTLVKLDEQVDHGPILAQVKESILPTDTAEMLYERLFKRGAKLLSQNINQYIKSDIKASEQDHSKATFTRRLTRQSGFIDLNNPQSPEKLDRMIRAFHPWPGVWTRTPTRSDLVQGQTLQGKIIKFLPGQSIQVEGGRPMTYKDFLNGYQEARQLLAKLGLLEEK